MCSEEGTLSYLLYKKVLLHITILHIGLYSTTIFLLLHTLVTLFSKDFEKEERKKKKKEFFLMIKRFYIDLQLYTAKYCLPRHGTKLDECVLTLTL